MSVWLWSPTFIISSFVSFSAILLAISCMKASRLSRPELSLSTWEGRLVCKKDNQELPTNLWDHFLDLFFSWFKSKSPHGNFQIFGVNHPLARRVKKAATGRCLQWRFFIGKHFQKDDNITWKPPWCLTSAPQWDQVWQAQSSALHPQTCLKDLKTFDIDLIMVSALLLFPPLTKLFPQRSIEAL